MSSHACWSAGGRKAPAVANRRRPPPNCAWTLRNRSRRTAYGIRRAMPRSRIERRRPALLLDLALDRAPEQVEHLGHEDHARDPVLAQRVEDHPRVAAADVEDVGADVERVVQRDRLLERVRQRQQRHDPVLHRVDDPVERHRSGEHVGVGQHHALGIAGRPRREHELEDVGGRRARPRRQLRLPVGREGVVRVGGQVLDDRRGEPLEPDLARVGRVAAAAEQQADGTRLVDDPRDRVRGHPGVERDEDQPRVHRAEVGGGQRGRRRGPGQHPIARVEPERLEPPGRDPAPPEDSAYVQCHVDPSSVRSPSACFAEPAGGVLEQVDDGLHGRLILAGRR